MNLPLFAETYFTPSCRQFLEDLCRDLWEYGPAYVRLTDLTNHVFPLLDRRERDTSSVA